ncbi:MULTISPECIES: alpha-ketoglutarate-dependent dioxygenase AlkB family protein [Nitratireductor]|uniref:alpha-ketoglutarate-dependent dioxygenase AlkB family protein n=1 Tax=Nitratireductor TaxID=245876 RepID=UPI000D0D3926|nr:MULTISPECIES: alpha-ketoglutarate-dependent dioxygenase AlkB [Nitratireductor]PSM19365.1 alkylated DNA repair dioxygenase [Nitratireductor sp. StC3]
MTELPSGVRHVANYLTPADQAALVDDIRAVVAEAPLYTPAMPRTGKPLSVRMTNCGALGWVTDRDGGYRYQPTHPATGRPWPSIPPLLTAIWNALSGYPHPPEACLVNFYAPGARMGLHQDRDEDEFAAPVLSISLGDACLFRVGGTQRGGRTVSIRLESGDLVVLGGAGRLCYHGVDRIYPGTSDLLRQPGRINLTLRRVTRPKP